MSSQRGKGRKRGRSIPELLTPSQSVDSQAPEEDGDEWTQSTQTQGSSRKTYEQMDSKLREEKVVAMLRYLLCYQKNTPLKRKELADKVMGDYKRAFAEIFEQANERLQSVFGLKAVEVYRMGSKAGQAATVPIASSRGYVLLSTLPPDSSSEHLQRSKESRAEMGLLSVILSLIMMKQGGISEDQLWNFLGRLGINPDDPHPDFRDVKRLINVEFVNQMYLDREKVVAGDKHCFTYRWGHRSKVEIDQDGMLELVAEIYGADFNQWKRQFGSGVSTSEDTQE